MDDYNELWQNTQNGFNASDNNNSQNGIDAAGYPDTQGGIYGAGNNDTQGESGSEIHSRIPITYVVTETQYNHPGTYTGRGSDDTGTDGGPKASSGGAGNGRDGRSSGVKLNAVKLIAICLVCSILGALAAIGGYKLLTGNQGTTEKVLSVTDDAQATAENASLSVSGETETPSATQQIVINVDSETVSPAAAVAAKVLPSVVGIQVKVTSTSYWYGTTTSGSEGSGVILSEDGYIVTNYHVISSMLTSAGEPNPNAELSIFLYTDPDTAIPGSVVGYDQGADLAVIKIDRTGLTAVELGDSDKVNVGDTAIAIGNPGGLQFLGSVSQGIISGLNRSIQIDTTYKSLKLIQTDAAINPGNSGGALTDIYGRLIGINSAKIAVDNFEGMGFAIPVNDVVSICTDIIKNGNVKAAYLGIELNTQYSATYLEQLGYPGGLLVKSVISGSPADNAGIEADDIIVSFNGNEVRTSDDLASLKNQCSSGDKVVIRIYRLTSSRFGRWTGEYYNVEVTLG